MATSVLSSVLTGGKLAVPDEVLDQLGLKEGDKVQFVIKEAAPVRPPSDPNVNPFEKYIGLFPAFESIEEINAYYRDLRDDEEGGLSKW